MSSLEAFNAMTSGGYRANPVAFDGSTYLYRNSDLSGNADSDSFIVSYWAKVGALGGSGEYVYCGGSTSNEQRVILDPDGVTPNRNNANITLQNSGSSEVFQANAGLFTENTWHHILASGDASDGYGQLYVDDGLVANFTINAGAVDFTQPNHRIGWDIGEVSARLTGELADIYINFGEYLDLSVTANRRKFIADSGKPVALGSDGSRPTGSQPIIFLSGSAATFAANKGSGGSFSVSGTLTNGSGVVTL